ncbi:MAG TPA: hypothetical protein VI874_02335 [Candidatus Norongarragalinales archaeon]|nr:hypothetical protein [Candidatus Norongarragalinales archaeon]
MKNNELKEPEHQKEDGPFDFFSLLWQWDKIGLGIGAAVFLMLLLQDLSGARPLLAGGIGPALLALLILAIGAFWIFRSYFSEKQ